MRKSSQSSAYVMWMNFRLLLLLRDDDESGGDRFSNSIPPTSLPQTLLLETKAYNLIFLAGFDVM